LPHTADVDREALRQVGKRYVFRANDYYLRLINWEDPNDPIRQLVIPHPDELLDGGKLDSSNEACYTVRKGVEHKYPDTVLLLCSQVCGAYCRYCFRKRLFMPDNDEVSLDVSEGLDYIRTHPEVTNVLLTGGDPLSLSTRRLADILARLRDIPHVKVIRLGSKMPAFNPWRILDDEQLQAALRQYSLPQRRIYLMGHFDHPRELTPEAMTGLECFQRNGVVCVNQCPLIGGVNDDPAVLAELFERLAHAGCTPYYVFQGRPVAGNRPFAVPIVQGFRIVEQARSAVDGLSARARFILSHDSGKLEVLAVDDRAVYMRYHRAAGRAVPPGRLLVFRRDDQAEWLDQLAPLRAAS
jgi:KamA family protein